MMMEMFGQTGNLCFHRSGICLIVIKHLGQAKTEGIYLYLRFQIISMKFKVKVKNKRKTYSTIANSKNMRMLCQKFQNKLIPLNMG
jgi:hypothetical protein